MNCIVIQSNLYCLPQGQASSAASADAVVAEAVRCREQLSSVQGQLQSGQKQLESADAALAAQRAAIAEADEQLAAVNRDVSVCEPRLASLRQQLQELEANIRAREAEHQVGRAWSVPVHAAAGYSGVCWSPDAHTRCVSPVNTNRCQ
jgi:septal ring factor EnvC (AmiA/AmiB activator)